VNLMRFRRGRFQLATNWASKRAAYAVWQDECLND
jgi:hypothetical protein